MRYIPLLWLMTAVLFAACSSPADTPPAESASATAPPSSAGNPAGTTATATAQNTASQQPEAPAATPATPASPDAGSPTRIPNTFVPPFDGDEFDGLWVGRTGLQQELEFEILNGSVAWMNIEFTIPGCNGDSPLGYRFSAADHPVDNDGFIAMELAGLYEVAVDARFLSFTDGIGFLEFTEANPCSVDMATEFTVSPRGRPVEPSPDLQLARHLPTLSIPPGLFLEDWKQTNPFDSTSLLAASGDWMLLRAFDSIFPVPKGWTVLSSGQSDATAFFAPGGVQVAGDLNVGLSIVPTPDVNIVFGQVLGTNYADSTVALEDITAGIVAPVDGVTFEVLASDVIDDDRAYLMFSVDDGEALSFTRIIVMSSLGRSSAASASGWDLTTATVETNRLRAYYPVIRAVLANRISALDGTVMGLSLPEELPRG